MKPRVPMPVWILGLVSLCNDVASEMIAPIVPIFLTTVLHTSIPVVGLIEGVAEATASITKYFFGAASDYFQKRKPFVLFGYGFGAASKLMIAFAGSWPLVLSARFIDRLGKGLRTAARDSILLSNTTPTNKGFIFGLHRTMDSLGAVIGPLLALLLLYWLPNNLRLVFLIAFIPGVVSVLLLLSFIHEPKLPTTKKQFVKIRWRELHPTLRLFLVSNFVFALGNSSDAFIILRGQNFGVTTATIILMYVTYQASQSLFSTPVGSLADKIGSRRVMVIGFLVFALVYAGFGLIPSAGWMWLLLPVYGLYFAFTDGVSKSYVSDFITAKESGTFFGLYYTLIGVGSLLASIVGGLLWNWISPSSTFFFGSVMAVVAAAVLLWANANAKRAPISPA